MAVARLGLVEILLKAAQRGRGLPQVLSSEAEVFATAWTSLIRQDEAIVRGVSADDRELAVLQIARELLTDNRSLSVPGMALSSLRSDGILISYGRTKVWSTGDQFASDVLRDFAVARLLVREGIRVLIVHRLLAGRFERSDFSHKHVFRRLHRIQLVR